jgi:hypothetical protein
VGQARIYKDSVEQVASSPAVAAPATGAATGAENPLAFLRYPCGQCSIDPDLGSMVNPVPKANLRHLAWLEIRDILVQIRIRGSVQLTKEDSAVFVIELQNAKKLQVFFFVFLLITFWRYIYIIFQR